MAEKKTKKKRKYDWEEELPDDGVSGFYDPDKWKQSWDKTNSTHFITARGNWIPLSERLIKFMGLNSAVFLTGLIDLYTLLRESRKVKKGQLFYSAPKFEAKWGLSRYHQKRAIKELKDFCLLKKVDGKTFRNETILRINFYGYCFIINLIYEISTNDLAYLSECWTSENPKHRRIRKLMKKAICKKITYAKFKKEVVKIANA